jgi:hypothetical protein
MNELAHCLKPGEWVEADNGYLRHPNKVKCPNNDCNPTENLAMQTRVRSRHVTFGGCLKHWGIIIQVYHHNITAHGTVFYACTVITQLAIDNSERLFEVEYED